MSISGKCVPTYVAKAGRAFKPRDVRIDSILTAA